MTKLTKRAADRAEDAAAVIVGPPDGVFLTIWRQVRQKINPNARVPDMRFNIHITLSGR